MYIRRWIEDKIKDLLKIFPVIVISGPRQVGKTTLLKNSILFKNAKYISFDDLGTLAILSESPSMVIPDSDIVIIDEVQRFPQILLEIKKIVDENPKRKFILSGSSNLLLLKNVSESLAGRAYYLYLQPFTCSEIKGYKNNFSSLLNADFDFKYPSHLNLEKQIFKGLFPKLIEFDKNIEITYWWQGYINTYLEKDLRSISNIQNLPQFANFIITTAERVGNLLNETSISNHTNISQSTISRYINLLETLFISFRVYQFRLSLAQGIKKMPKIYIADTGLICSLLKIKDQKIPQYLKGKLFENFIFQQLLVHTSLMGAELFFWREKQKEIDFIISYNHNIFPIEVKLSKKVNIADAKNIIEFSKRTKISNGFVIYNGNEIIQIGKKIYAIPWYLL